jgi:hypothetical protein
VDSPGLLACRIGVATLSVRAAAATSARKREEGPKSALMRTAMVFELGLIASHRRYQLDLSFLKIAAGAIIDDIACL